MTDIYQLVSIVFTRDIALLANKYKRKCTLKAHGVIDHWIFVVLSYNVMMTTKYYPIKRTSVSFENILSKDKERGKGRVSYFDKVHFGRRI